MGGSTPDVSRRFNLAIMRRCGYIAIAKIYKNGFSLLHILTEMDRFNKFVTIYHPDLVIKNRKSYNALRLMA